MIKCGNCGEAVVWSDDIADMRGDICADCQD